MTSASAAGPTRVPIVDGLLGLPPRHDPRRFYRM
jgi:hypothetical protein